MEIQEILQASHEIKDPRQRRIRVFNFVREIPYYVGGEQSYEYVLKNGHGDCKGKADLLARLFNALGYPTRPVMVRYKLRNLPEEVRYIPNRIDYHHTLEVFAENRWILADATYDSPLGAGGYLINEWDGFSDTRSCQKPLRIKRGEASDPLFDREFSAFSQALDLAFERHPNELKEYTKKYNAMIQRIREGSNHSLHIP